MQIDEPPGEKGRRSQGGSKPGHEERRGNRRDVDCLHCRYSLRGREAAEGRHHERCEGEEDAASDAGAERREQRDRCEVLVHFTAGSAGGSNSTLRLAPNGFRAICRSGTPSP